MYDIAEPLAEFCELLELPVSCDILLAFHHSVDSVKLLELIALLLDMEHCIVTVKVLA